MLARPAAASAEVTTTSAAAPPRASSPGPQSTAAITYTSFEGNSFRVEFEKTGACAAGG